MGVFLQTRALSKIVLVNFWDASMAKSGRPTIALGVSCGFSRPGLFGPSQPHSGGFPSVFSQSGSSSSVTGELSETYGKRIFGLQIFKNKLLFF